MKRFGMVIGLKPESEKEYRKHHAAVWPEVLETLRQCNIRNYSIYLKNGMLYRALQGMEDMARQAGQPEDAVRYQPGNGCARGLEEHRR
jgi:L-rhamnose mutarotase